MMIIEYLHLFFAFVSDYVAMEIIVIIFIFVFSRIYGIIRAGRWRKILSSALDYHRFHLEMIMNDPSADIKNKELAQAMVWAITRQMPDDLKDKGGGAALFRSLLGQKTALNTCGTIFYDIAKNFKFIDKRILKLNTTLTSTFYRVYFIESFASGVALLFMDIFMLKSIVLKPSDGSARLYYEMRRELKSNSKG
ncbi:MAG: hypothetical protein WDA74_01510 [Spirochaetota bacterium]